MSIFQRTDFLLPKPEFYRKWPVIACDQFTSQPEYWSEVKRIVADAPSSYYLIYPEAALNGDRDKRIQAIQSKMREYWSDGVFRNYPNSYIYVERTLQDGTVRKGIVGVIDLEEYDYHEGSHSRIRPTEQTVIERIPPRVQIRSGASMELSHVLLLCDEKSNQLIGAVEAKKDALAPLYSIDLMQNGGHLSGWLVSGEAADCFDRELNQYVARQEQKENIVFAVGDGNHSLAAAKACWEEIKKKDPGNTSHPARYAMVELENLQDDAQRFEPIHRIVKQVNVKDLLSKMDAICAKDGMPVRWASASEDGVIFLNPALGTLPVGILQSFLDAYLAENGGSIDYIHGEKAVLDLSGDAGSIAFILPDISKNDFFDSIAKDGALPRKTFSMGHAEEKRYYMECRFIK